MLEITDTKQVLQKDMTSGVFNSLSENSHEQVLFCYDAETGLKAIIAIHNTVLGPALGGTRMWVYKSEEEALRDVLRLSRGMTYKASISGLNLGGGKAVIIGDSKKDKTEAMFRKFGRFIKNLNGKYITAEDVGTTTRDMSYIRMETTHVTGLPESSGGGGDPSPVTAYGVFLGMKASLKERTGSDSLGGKRILVQGVGNVGEALVKLLAGENAKIFISDINDTQLQKVSGEFGCEIVEQSRIFDHDMDIYAPCALGAVLNSDSIARLKCSIVAGSANNQLEDEAIHGQLLLDKGILYAPDFLINAGGLINAYSEYQGYNRDRAMQDTERIYQLTLDIFKKSVRDGVTTVAAAKKIAEERISSIAKLKSTY
jgi:leucine dehydrogenase